MAPAPKLDPAAIAALADQGFGAKRIAAALGVELGAVRSAVRKERIVLNGQRREPDFPDHPPRRRPAGPAHRVGIDIVRLADLVAAGLGVAELERSFRLHRRTLHRVARAAGVPMPKCPYRSREDWIVLIVEHGLDVRAIAAATGQRRSYVRDALVGHGLLRTWWGRRGRRYAEWTMGEED